MLSANVLKVNLECLCKNEVYMIYMIRQKQ